MGFYGFILVFVGGGLGSALRHGTNLLALRLVGSAYPLGTLAINVLGAFVMGVVPLVLSSGAGSEMRSAMGVAVFAGMIGVTAFGLFLTPVFYVLLRRLTGNRTLKLHGEVVHTEAFAPAGDLAVHGSGSGGGAHPQPAAPRGMNE